MSLASIDPATGQSSVVSTDIPIGSSADNQENGNNSNPNSSIENSPTQAKTEPVDEPVRETYDSSKYSNSDYLSLYQGMTS